MKKSRRKADIVADELMSEIVNGKIKVGSLLPVESELAERFGVNRGVIREAIKLLEVHKLVQPVRRKGTVVLDHIKSTSPQVVRAVIFPEPGKINVNEFRHLLDLRMVTETELIVLAAQNRTEADLQELDACIQRLEESLGDRVAYHKESGIFAVKLAEASHNKLFVRMAYWFADVTETMHEQFAAVRPMTSSAIDARRSLVEVLRRQDVEYAREAFSKFIRWANEQLLMSIEAHQKNPLDLIAQSQR